MSANAENPSLDRYHRQMLLADFGRSGQLRLQESHAVVIGCGALGTVAAESLARAGIGRLTIIDRDVVELTNLPRQTLFSEADARSALPKAVAARNRLASVNREVIVDAIVEDFTYRSAPRTLRNSDVPVHVVLDCTDNFETRFLVNDAAVKFGIPYVYAGAVGTVGMARAVLPRARAPASSRWPDSASTPCLRCLFELPPPPGTAPTCDTAGVLAPAPGIAALFQVSEALKILLGKFDLIRRELVVIDVWDGPVRTLDVGSAFDLDCPCCVHGHTPWLDGTYSSEAVGLCGRNAVQIDAHSTPSEEPAEVEVQLRAVGDRLRPHGDVLTSTSLVRCTLRNEPSNDGGRIELTVFADGRTIVRGTRDAIKARSLVARYVGA